MTTISVPVTKVEKNKLQKMALEYGLTISELIRRVVAGLKTSLETETLADYANPREVAASLRRAYKDYKAGRVRSRL